MSPSSNWYQLSVNYHLPPHVQKFVQDVVGFVLLVQTVEVVLCAFTRVMSLRGSVETTAEVTSLNRRDMFQSHHLVSFRRSAETAAQPGGFKIPDFLPAQRGNGGAAGWLQDSGLGAVMGDACPFFGP